MKLFLISPTDHCRETAKKLIEENFEGHYFTLENRESPLWIVAAPTDRTPAQISEIIGMRTGAQPVVSGVVLEVSDYFGLDSKGLWQQLSVWQNAAD